MPYYLRSQFGCHRLTAPRFNFSPVAGMFKGDASFPSAEGDDSRLLHALELGKKKKINGWKFRIKLIRAIEAC